MNFTGKNGAEIIINEADFDSAVALKNAVERQLVGTLKGDLSMDSLFDAFLLVDSSPEVNAALFKCLIRSTYNGMQITKATFEPSEARLDYFDIAKACVEVNLTPFFQGLVSKLSGIIQGVQALNTQK